MRLKVEVKSPLSALCILLAAHWSHFDHDSYLSRKFSISSYGCPVVRPSLICPNPFRYHRFDCESVTSFHYSDSFVFGIVWYIRSTVEKFMDSYEKKVLQNGLYYLYISIENRNFSTMELIFFSNFSKIRLL